MYRNQNNNKMKRTHEKTTKLEFAIIVETEKIETKTFSHSRDSYEVCIGESCFASDSVEDSIVEIVKSLNLHREDMVWLISKLSKLI